MSRVARALQAVLAVAIVLRLGGVSLPGPDVPALVVLLGLVAIAARAGSGPRAAVDRLGVATWLYRHRFGLGLAALAAVSLAIAVPGMSADLYNAPLDIDEHRLASTVRHFMETGEIPHRTVEDYPGVFYWMVTAFYTATYLVLLLGDRLTWVREIPGPHLVHAGRMLTLLVYAATVAVTGLLARRCARTDHESGRFAGWLAAAIVALSPMGIDIALQFRNDTMLTLLMAGAALAAMHAVDRGEARSLWLGGLCAGLAAGVKYTGVFALAPLLVAGLRMRGAGWRAPAATFGAFAVALAVSNPFLWLDFPNFLEQLGTEVAMTGEGHWAATAAPRWFYTEALAGSLGWPLLLMAGTGAVLAMARPHPKPRLLLWSAIPYVLFLTGQPSQFARWVQPLLPPAACLAAWTVARLVPLVRSRVRERAALPAFLSLRVEVLLALLLLAPVMLAAGRTASRGWVPDTFERTKAIVAERLDAGDWLLAPWYWLDTLEPRPRLLRGGPQEVYLDGDPIRLAAYDWILVPEPSRDTAERLGLVAEHVVLADYSAFGAAGFDFVLARGAEPPEPRRQLVLDPTLRRGASHFDPLWRLDAIAEAAAGAPVVAGAPVYLPLRRGLAYEIEIDFGFPSGGREAVPLVYLDGRPLPPSGECDRTEAEDAPVRLGCIFSVAAEVPRDRPDLLTFAPSVTTHLLRIAASAEGREADSG